MSLGRAPHPLSAVALTCSLLVVAWSVGAPLRWTDVEARLTTSQSSDTPRAAVKQQEEQEVTESEGSGPHVPFQPIACPVLPEGSRAPGQSWHAWRRGHGREFVRLEEPRSGATGNVLGGGQILIAGGDRPPALDTAEMVEPGSWNGSRLLSRLLTARAQHTATSLPDGTVLLAGGRDLAGALSVSEVFDPAARTFDPGPTLGESRSGHTSTVLIDGRAWLLGGEATTVDESFVGSNYVAGMPVYSSRTGTFAPAGSLLQARRWNHSATTLPDGRILIIGGRNDTGVLRSAEILDPAAGTSRLLASALATAREGHTATLLPSGVVLIAGGSDGRQPLAAIETFDPRAERFSSCVSRLTLARAEHTAVLLEDGVVMIAGGVTVRGASDDVEFLRWLRPDPTAPVIAGTFPAAGATDQPLTTVVGIRFSEPIDPTTLDGAVAFSTGDVDVPVRIAHGEAGLYAFAVAEQPLEPHTTYVVRVAGVRDLSGRALAADATWSFTTGAPLDSTPPSLAGTGPANGAIDVAIDVTPYAVFDESLDPPTVTTATVSLSTGTTGITATVSYEESGHRILIAPAAPLAYGTAYTVLLKGGGAGIKDLAGNPLASDVSWSFTTVVPFTVTTLVVSPRGASVSTGGAQQFTATATFSDGTSRDVTAEATWASSNSTVASVIEGLATAQAAGLAAITAEFGGKTAEGGFQAADGDPLPPDPAWVAPPLDRRLPTVMADATAFLYTGENPIQQGVAPGTIARRRAAALRGRVLDRAGAPVPGAQVTIAGHPELGSTRSRADGMYDLAVNGGGELTLRVAASGYLPVDRQITAGWQDFTTVPDLALTRLDPAVTVVQLDAPAAIQVARGSAVTDEDGTRRATVLVPAGTGASFVLPDGTVQPATTLSVRATEYTAGQDGPAAMPAPLPPTSAYTYAAEFSVDEAMSAGAREVRFTRPVYVYLENFLGFPVGGGVPVGSYDREKRAWVPSRNGRIIGVLDVSGGIAVLDVNGSGTAATPEALAALDITDAERQTLATLYQAGQSLWRVPLEHFSPCDMNYAFGLPDDARAANTRRPGSESDEDSDCDEGSIVACQSRSLGEKFPIVGTPFELVYSSTRMAGRRGADRLRAELSGAELPFSLKRIDFEVTIAGRTFKQSFPPQTGQSIDVPWDGRDVYGRPMQGLQTATVRIGYVYDSVYLAPASDRGFGEAGGPVVYGETRQEMTLWREDRATVGRRDVLAEGLGGWTIDVHHLYEAGQQAIDFGDGSRRTSIDVVPEITSSAGTGQYGSTGDGGPATAATFQRPQGLRAGADGSLYVSDQGALRQVRPDGIIVKLGSAPGDLAAAGPDGSLYFVNTSGQRVYRRFPDGTTTVVAGSGTRGFSGDGGPATEANLWGPTGAAVSADGTLYIADNYNGRIRKVDTGGIITTIAGTGEWGSTGDGGPAVNATLMTPYGLAIARDGSLLITDGSAAAVRRISPDGIISTFAGTGRFGYSGDGGAATAAELDLPYDVTVERDGSVLIADYYNGRVRKVTADGIITTLAGDGTSTFTGDQRPATGAAISPLQVAFGPDGALYVNDWSNRRIRKVAAPLPGLSVGDVAISSEQGDGVFVFDAAGRHLRTLEMLSGAPLYTFEYDAAGLLAAIVDRDGLRTHIERGAGGRATAIVSPGGQRTSLTIDERGLLAALTAPGPETLVFEYTDDGLLNRFTDPAGTASAFTWDADGRLVTDESPTGSTLTLASTEAEGLLEATLHTALGRTDTFRIRTLGDQTIERTTIDAAGLQTFATIRPNGTRQVTSPDGTVAELTETGDPRWGLQVPILSSSRIRLPSGLESVMSMQREVSLLNPSDPFSMEWQTDTLTINGRAFATTYDATVRQLFTVTAAWRQTQTDLDDRGRVIAWRPAGITAVEFTYDDRGRIASVRQGTRSWSLEYDAHDRLARLTDPLNHSLAFQYDAYNRVSNQTLAGGGVIALDRDPNGLLTGMTPPGRRRHALTYTGGMLTNRYTSPGGLSLGYTYNQDDELTVMSSGDGNTQIGYDSAGRVSSVTSPDATVTYTYNSAGTVQSISRAGSGTLHYSFDGPLLTGWEWEGAVSGYAGHAFDANYWVTAESVNDQFVVTFDYDADGLTTRAGDEQIWRQWDTGLLSGTSIGRLGDSLAYDEYGAVSTYTAQDYATGTLFDQQFTRDAAGRITDIAETVDGVLRLIHYEYDADGRLASVSVNGTTLASYTYDANGNRTSRQTAFAEVAATFDDDDKLLSNGGVTYEYNASGQLVRRTAGTQVTSYRYDALGNLLDVDLPDGRRIEYIVDGRNRRIGKRIDGTLVRGFLYDDEFAPLAELDGSNNIVSRFVYGSRPNVPDYMVRGGRTFRIFSDYRGSPRVVVDTETGEIVQRIDYDEYGVVTQDTNPGFQPFGYNGGLYDPDTRLTRFGLRDYDPEVGRWTTRDPLGLDGGPNLFAYAGGDPINGVDLSGLLSMKDVSDFAAGFGDSLSLGLTDLVREALGWNDVVDKCSNPYKAGEATDVALEMAGLGVSGAMKNAAKNANKKAVRRAADKITRKMERSSSSARIHHQNPLFGHSGSGGTIFPTGGLPPEIHSGGWNLKELPSQAAHQARHNTMKQRERYLGKVVNPFTTGARLARGIAGDCKCK